MRSIVWFRRDLRILDNRAFFNATHDSQEVVAVFFITRLQWQMHHDAPGKIAFWLENLQALKRSLDQLNVPILIREIPTFKAVPAELAKIAKKLNASRVYFNAEYEVNESRRDCEAEKLLRKSGVECLTFHDRILLPPGKVLTGAGKPYTVFTPFKNNWAKQILKNDIRVLPAPVPQRKILEVKSDTISVSGNCMKSFNRRLWPVGESAAKERLESFVLTGAKSYDQKRDLPAVEGTSRLSPYLASGIISCRHCLRDLIHAHDESGKLPSFDSSLGCWLNELVWRDFYSHVLAAFPRVSKGIPFQLKTLKINWRCDEKQLQCWKDGNTGYPIVDAAMRQLKQTGWMHNRLRMVAAMFLSKHLLLDWRQGERWFMENLIDGELSANNGGWQWSASTGTDAAPYFRVFNPFSQSKRFDSKGLFIRKYCPELEKVSDKALHDPGLLVKEITNLKLDYPEPIVNHAEARKRAIDAFKTETEF